MTAETLLLSSSFN